MSHSNSQAMKRKLLADFNAVVHEADQLLTSIADEGGDKAEALRGKVERNRTPPRRGCAIWKTR